MFQHTRNLYAERPISIVLTVVAALLIPGAFTAFLLSIADAFEEAFERIGPLLGLLIVPAVFSALAIWRLRIHDVRLEIKAWHGQTVSQGILFGAVVFVSNNIMTFFSLFVASLFMGVSESEALAMSEQGRVFNMFEQATAWETVYIVVILVFITPVAEELFFRGYLYTTLRSRWGKKECIVLSGLIFSLFHFYRIQFLPVFVAGCLLAWLYERSKSILSPIVAHAVVNGIVVILLFIQLRG